MKNFLYTPLEEAAEELRRRRQNKSLCNAVAEFQKNNPPHYIGNAPFLALCRAVFTADDELETLLHKAATVSLSPFLMELRRDRFSSKNADKNALCKMRFLSGKRIKNLRIIDFDKYDGKPFCEIQTLSGQPIIDYHHCLIKHTYPDRNLSFVDFSNWAYSFGNSQFYYVPYLSLFVTQGILLENFIWGDEEERRFTEARVIPAFNIIMDHFGVKPLIVRAYTELEESNPKHWFYDDSLYAFAKDLLENPDLICPNLTQSPASLE